MSDHKKHTHLKEGEGYMQLPHRVTENIIRQKLSGAQLAVLLLLLRYSWGYQQPETMLSEQFAASKIACHPIAVNRALKELKERGIITRTKPPGPGKPSHYRFNDDTSLWREITDSNR